MPGRPLFSEIALTTPDEKDAFQTANLAYREK
jgi:hypothetical protein